MCIPDQDLNLGSLGYHADALPNELSRHSDKIATTIVSHCHWSIASVSLTLLVTFLRSSNHGNLTDFCV